MRSISTICVAGVFLAAAVALGGCGGESKPVSGAAVTEDPEVKAAQQKSEEFFKTHPPSPAKAPTP